MIEGLLILLLCQLAGTLVADTLHLPIPGAVLGMLLLLGLLAWRRPAEDAPVMTASHHLLQHLPLLFVPAGVGVVAVLPQIVDNSVPVVGSGIGRVNEMLEAQGLKGSGEFGAGQ